MSRGKLYIDGKFAGTLEHIEMEQEIFDVQTRPWGPSAGRVKGEMKVNVRLTKNPGEARDWVPRHNAPHDGGVVAQSIRDLIGKEVTMVVDHATDAFHHLKFPKQYIPNDTTMKTNKLLSLLQTNFVTIQVTFGDGQGPYTYKAPKCLNLQAGDEVVVDTKRGTKVVNVVSVDAGARIDVNAPFEYKWIVCKVDRTAYNDQLETERKFVQAMEEVERIKEGETMLKSFRDSLPEGTEARLAFEAALSSVTGKTEAAAPEQVLATEMVLEGKAN